MRHPISRNRSRIIWLLALSSLIFPPLNALSRAARHPATELNRAALTPQSPSPLVAATANGRIAFVSDRDRNRDDNTEIYVMNPDGSAPVNVTNNPAADYDPAWSPDGARLAFVSRRTGNPEIYVMDADGRNVKRLTNSAAREAQPAWSPDGSRIAFTRDSNEVVIAIYPPPVGPDIFVMNADGSDQKNLTNTALGEYKPAWSPDGAKIAFFSNRDASGSAARADVDIFVMNADGSSPVNITNNPAADTSPAWSPDGTKIAFASTRGGNSNFDIYTMNVDGGNVVRLTDYQGTDDNPVWSPDGAKIAYTSTAGVNAPQTNDYDFEIYVMDADGGNKVNITKNDTNDSVPAWQPLASPLKPGQGSNGRIAFASERDNGREIYAVNPEGGAQTNLTNNPAIDYDPAYSPDGTQIAFVSTRDDGKPNIYVMNQDGSNLRKLTNINNDVSYCLYSPTWSPDGTRIAFLNGFMCVEIMKIQIVNVADGASAVPQNSKLNELSISNSFDLKWSPDGTRFVFDGSLSSAYGVGIERGIFVMNVDGGGVTRVAGVDGSQPAWSPTGTRIAFTVKREPFGYGGAEIFITGVSGGDTPTRLTNNAVDDGFPAWSPDGTRIAFARGDLGTADGASAIYSVNLDGSDEKLIASCAFERPGFVCKNTSPDWQRVGAGAPLPPPSPGTLQFSHSEYRVAEGRRADFPYEDAGSISITVTRLGDTSGAASVDYSASGFTASDASDFIATSGTLRFAPGESQKSFTVLITDDTLAESSEKVDLKLRNEVGGNLGGNHFASLTIIDNDSAGTNVNKIDTVDGFVRQQYLDFLNREPDAPGFEFWKQTLARYLSDCGAADTPQAVECRMRAKARTSEAFFVSVEFQQTGYLVYRLYQTAFDKDARPRGLPRFAEFVRDTQEIGRGVVVNAEGWEQKLRENTEAFLIRFVQRAEFTQRYPEAMTREEYVDALYETARLTQTRTQQERDAALAAYGAGGVEGRARALRVVAESKRMFLREFNKAFVLMQYFGYLRRNPDEGQDAPVGFAGYDFWLAKLDAASSDTTRFNSIEELLAPVHTAQMVEAFVVTGEYRRRFGPE